MDIFADQAGIVRVIDRFLRISAKVSDLVAAAPQVGDHGILQFHTAVIGADDAEYREALATAAAARYKEPAELEEQRAVALAAGREGDVDEQDRGRAAVERIPGAAVAVADRQAERFDSYDYSRCRRKPSRRKRRLINPCVSNRVGPIPAGHIL